MRSSLNDETYIEELTNILTQVIAETNGINILDTLELLLKSKTLMSIGQKALVKEFESLILGYQHSRQDIGTLLKHPVAKALFNFFERFPLRYCEDHIHLTGSLTACFIHQELKPLLDGPNSANYMARVHEIFGGDVGVDSEGDLKSLIHLRSNEEFDRYLKILELPALILKDREVHSRAAYHMAKTLYDSYNIGRIKLKFTFSRVSNDPTVLTTSPKEVVMGLFEGFRSFQREHPDFDFNLSPSFRKEAHYFHSKYKSKKESFDDQVKQLLELIRDHPELSPYLNEVDTVGNERELYRKGHFRDMKDGFRLLQAFGFAIRSHHGEVWHTLGRGVQAVDNAMNIWQINNLEHGLSLGINPNYYFHSLYQRIVDGNRSRIPITPNSRDYCEIMDMDWGQDLDIRDGLIRGDKLNGRQMRKFTKAKFRTAMEIERYQHDVLNRMIQKNISLVALPSSNKRLTGNFSDYKDHPFSWWEKKGVTLGVGTDNYVTLKTNYINEMLILLFSDPDNLKITKILMVTTGESRRPYLSNLLWQQAKKTRKASEEGGG